eukprot:355276-Chlamydomonas_euryale.AAC.5
MGTRRPPPFLPSRAGRRCRESRARNRPQPAERGAVSRGRCLPQHPNGRGDADNAAAATAGAGSGAQAFGPRRGGALARPSVQVLQLQTHVCACGCGAHGQTHVCACRCGAHGHSEGGRGAASGPLCGSCRHV